MHIVDNASSCANDQPTLNSNFKTIKPSHFMLYNQKYIINNLLLQDVIEEQKNEQELIVNEEFIHNNLSIL